MQYIRVPRLPHFPKEALCSWVSSPDSCEIPPPVSPAFNSFVFFNAHELYVAAGVVCSVCSAKRLFRGHILEPTPERQGRGYVRLCLPCGRPTSTSGGIVDVKISTNSTQVMHRGKR